MESVVPVVEVRGEAADGVGAVIVLSATSVCGYIFPQVVVAPLGLISASTPVSTGVDHREDAPLRSSFGWPKIIGFQFVLLLAVPLDSQGSYFFLEETACSEHASEVQQLRNGDVCCDLLTSLPFGVVFKGIELADKLAHIWLVRTDIAVNNLFVFVDHPNEAVVFDSFSDVEVVLTVRGDGCFNRVDPLKIHSCFFLSKLGKLLKEETETEPQRKINAKL